MSQTTETLYVVGIFRRIGRTWGNSWVNHIGVVDHIYGSEKQYAYVRTLCGRTGAIKGKAHSQPKGRVECGTCQKVWEKRSAA